MPRISVQKNAFLQSEGDAWFRRNSGTHIDLDAAAQRDPLLLSFRKLNLFPNKVLEIGASDGWRLECLRRVHPQGQYFGIEPSSAAVASGRERYPQLILEMGTADDLQFAQSSMDLIVFGFCLYLCDRSDLFHIASEADRVLAPDGMLAIYDFHSEAPYRNRYTHLDGLVSYKMDYASMFTWNPAYRVQYRDIFPHPASDGNIPAHSVLDDCVAVTVLRRDLQSAWPARSYKN